MSRRRKVDKGLPRRVYFRKGSYQYYSPVKIRDPKDGKLKSWIILATEFAGEAAMLTALGALKGGVRNEQGSMPYACAEYKAGKLKKLTPETRAQYSQYLDMIADDFEDFYAAQVTTKEIAGFIRTFFKDKPNTAQKYAALFKKLFKFIIGELGLRADNPADQLDLSDYDTERREVLPTHEQIQRIRAAGMASKPRADTGKTLPTASGPMFACLIDMSYLAWQRAIDIRTLKESQIEGGYIKFKPSKTLKTSSKTVDILITVQIQEIIDRARAIKKTYKVHGHDLITPYLFPTRTGGAYKKTGLFSMWDRARERAGITEDVTFKDIRALGATDAAKRGEHMSDIQMRLAHTSSRTSEIYIKESVPGKSGIEMDLPWKN